MHKGTKQLGCSYRNIYELVHLHTIWYIRQIHIFAFTIQVKPPRNVANYLITNDAWARINRMESGWNKVQKTFCCTVYMLGYEMICHWGCQWGRRVRWGGHFECSLQLLFANSVEVFSYFTVSIVIMGHITNCQPWAFPFYFNHVVLMWVIYSL